MKKITLISIIALIAAIGIVAATALAQGLQMGSGGIIDGTITPAKMSFDVISSSSGADLTVDIGLATNGQGMIKFNHTFASAPYVFLTWQADITLEAAITNATVTPYTITTTSCLFKTYAPVTGGLTNIRYIAIGTL
jgi:hypothetical protein